VDALEALLAALYLDAGIEKARDFVTRCVVGDPSVNSVFSADDLPVALTDFKSALQELARARNLALPRYVIVKEQGPEHSKTFTIEVRLGKDWVAQAEGYSKKNAAQNAARVIFEQLSGTKPGASL
jgi:ribonuclease-3